VPTQSWSRKSAVFLIESAPASRTKRRWMAEISDYFIPNIINLYLRIKSYIPDTTMSLKINYLTLRSKVTWRSWWYITYCLLVAHIYTKYHKSTSKNKKVTFLIRKCILRSIFWTGDQKPQKGRDYISHTLLVAHIYTKYHKSMSKDKKRLHLGRENALKNRFDLEINVQRKVVMLPHPPSDSRTPSSQIW
jgi:hypothetical protein